MISDTDVERHLTHQLTYNERAMIAYPIGPAYIDGVLVYNDSKGGMADRDEYFVYCEDCGCQLDMNNVTVEPLSTVEGLLEVMKNDN